MPIAITLTLQSEANAVLPHQLGRANYAAMLARIRQVDGTLADLIHDGGGAKPLTCSSLIGAPVNRTGMAVGVDKFYHLRITGLTDAVSQALVFCLLEEPPETWTLAEHTFQVAQAICNPGIDPWTGQTTYEELAAAQLLQSGHISRKVALVFRSPTSFQSKGMHVPVPMPNFVFGSLVNRWNAFSPVTLSPEMRRFGEEMVALSNYQFQSQPVIQKSGAPIIGGVGRATYTALGGDRYWLATMQMLADFALYSGVGVKSTIGMGQTRRLIKKTYK